MMTLNEFSYEFDVLASSYLQEGGFTVSDSSILAFNEYEKSVYLTREMEGVVQSLYSDRSASGSFEQTEQLRRALDTLVTTVVLEPDSDTSGFTSIVGGSQRFRLPDDLWFIVYEAGRYDVDKDDKCRYTEAGYPVTVIPVTHDAFHRVKDDPFRGPSERFALRLDNGMNTYKEKNVEWKLVDVTAHTVEIVPKHPLGAYYVKYVRHPKPIILVSLTDGLSINGVSEATPCELHESLHRLILDGAVRAAVNSRVRPSKEESS